MNVEKITPQAIDTLNAARPLVDVEHGNEIRASLYLGQGREKLTHISATECKGSGWLIIGAHDMNSLDEDVLADLEGAPQLSAPVTHAGVTHMHVNWCGHAARAFWRSTPSGPVGWVFYPPNFMGDGYDTHDNLTA